MNAAVGFSAANSGSIIPALSAEIAADTLFISPISGSAGRD